MKIRLLNLSAILLLLPLVINCISKKEYDSQGDDFIVGVKIYEHTGEFNELFENFEDVGINTVFASIELISNNEFKNQAREKGIRIFAILPVFYAPEELEEDSTLFSITQYGGPAEEEWVKFACPSDVEFRQNKIDFIKDFVNIHQPDAISLDFIRHFTYWEKIYPAATLNHIKYPVKSHL